MIKTLGVTSVLRVKAESKDCTFITRELMRGFSLSVKSVVNSLEARVTCHVISSVYMNRRSHTSVQNVECSLVGNTNSPVTLRLITSDIYNFYVNCKYFRLDTCKVYLVYLARLLLHLCTTSVPSSQANICLIQNFFV